MVYAVLAGLVAPLLLLDALRRDVPSRLRRLVRPERRVDFDGLIADLDLVWPLWVDLGHVPLEVRPDEGLRRAG